jgi:hypothetical protein
MLIRALFESTLKLPRFGILFLTRFNLGVLYEMSNNQTSDAIDSYSRALDLDPQNAIIKQRLVFLRNPPTGSLSPTISKPPSPKEMDLKFSNAPPVPPADNPASAPLRPNVLQANLASHRSRSRPQI